jgi:thiosulfate dehydrogenase [quinone] large subunit
MALIALRTVIGWHFLYEGYYKLALPGWSRDGAPLARWTSAAYFKISPGPLGRLFQRLVEAGWVGWIDNAVKISLLLIGLSLILGLFTRAGCAGAIALLTLFYLTSIPLSGIQQPVSEGAYLLVNKTLVEGVAACVLFTFGTGEIAGLDLLLKTRPRKPLAIETRAHDLVPATDITAPHSQSAFQPGKE